MIPVGDASLVGVLHDRCAAPGALERIPADHRLGDPAHRQRALDASRAGSRIIRERRRHE
jgi:hypothetical protein